MVILNGTNNHAPPRNISRMGNIEARPNAECGIIFHMKQIEGLKNKQTNSRLNNNKQLRSLNVERGSTRSPTLIFLRVPLMNFSDWPLHG